MTRSALSLSLARVLPLPLVLALAARAHAGGLEVPDNGTEALGRGGAFAAKADDPTALHHNVGGLAQQRGTRLLLDANVSRSSLAFQRSGTYPGDPNDPLTPWAGKRYPLAESQGGTSILPFVAATTDLGLPGVTFALGTFPPHAPGGRVYPLAVGGKPSPARYDAIGGMPNLVLFHTAAVGFKLGDAIDIGIAAHVVQATIGIRMIAYMARFGDCAKLTESVSCDGRGEGTVSGWSGTGSLGALIRPGNGVGIGVHVRGPTYLQPEGVAKLTAPPIAAGAVLEDTKVVVKTELPWIVRAGIRKAFGPQAADSSLDEAGRGKVLETGDVELDVTYEGWGAAMNPGPEIHIEKLGPFGRATRTSLRNYHDTFSVRAGGSVTTTGFGTPVILRAGAFYDASATDPAATRLETDTLPKVAGTLGVGVRFATVRFDLAYASVFDVARTVTRGEVRSTDNAPAVNEGTYQGHTHLASVGAVFELDRIFGTPTFPRLAPDRDRVAAREPSNGSSRITDEPSAPAPATSILAKTTRSTHDHGDRPHGTSGALLQRR